MTGRVRSTGFLEVPSHSRLFARPPWERGACLLPSADKYRHSPAVDRMSCSTRWTSSPAGAGDHRIAQGADARDLDVHGIPGPDWIGACWWLRKSGRVAPDDYSPEALTRTGQGGFHYRMLSTTYRHSACGAEQAPLRGAVNVGVAGHDTVAHEPVTSSRCRAKGVDRVGVPDKFRRPGWCLTVLDDGREGERATIGCPRRPTSRALASSTPHRTARREPRCSSCSWRLGRRCRGVQKRYISVEEVTRRRIARGFPGAVPAAIRALGCRRMRRNE